MPIELEMVLRLLLATALGGVIGFQRERAGKPAGIRTYSLICIGSALFTIASALGFLGAGAIMRREEGIVEGLTTAATVWVVAGVGLTAGAGMYVIAPVATAIVLIVLYIPHPKD